MKNPFRPLLALLTYLLVMLLPGAGLFGQTVSIYAEDFSYADGTSISSNWTLDASQCVTTGSSYHFYVSAQQLEGRNLGGEAVWKSKIIDIHNYANVDANMTFTKSGTLATGDYLKISYILNNNGIEIPFTTNGTLLANYSNGTASQTALTGTTLQLVVRMKNNSAGKIQRIDNVSITNTTVAVLPLAVLTSSTNESCAGRANGTATLLTTGGTPPYTYKWSNNEVTPSVSNLTQGSYTVTVADATAQTQTVTVAISALPSMNIVSSSHSASLNISDGLAKIQVSGGTPPYLMQWNNGSVGATDYHLKPGTYTVTVSDLHQCTAVKSVIVGASTATTLFHQDFDSLYTPLWRTLSFAGNISSNIWMVSNSTCSIDNYSLQIGNHGAPCTYDNGTTQDVMTYLPVNATGYDSLVLSFNWLSQGETNFDFGSVWYSADSINWQLIRLGGNGLGYYTDRQTPINQSLLLPDSLKNRPFYIGFNWTNDNNLGSPPGFVVDDIIITGRSYTTAPVFNSGPTCTWLGNDAFWNNPINWDCGHLPLPTDNVFIPASTPFQPNIMKGMKAACKNLTLAANTYLTASAASSLEIYGDVNAQSVINITGGTVWMKGEQTQHITLTGATIFNDFVTLNTSDSGIVLGSNLSIHGTLSLMRGMVVTGSDTLILLNPYPTTPGILSYSNNSHIVGNLRRYVTPNYFRYDFPVGNMGDSSLFQANIMPHNLIGVDYLTASFVPLANNDDRQLAVSDNSISYNKMCNEGIWVIEPNMQPTVGWYDVSVTIENFHNLQDNTFAIVKRPVGTDANDWCTGAGTIPSDFSPGRTVGYGMAERDGLTTFSEFGVAHIDTGTVQNNFAGHFQHGPNIVVLNWNDTTFKPTSTRILRSFDGENFTPVAHYSISGSGTSFKTSDDEPEKGLVFYQLESTDKNGNTIHSNTITVNCVAFADDELLVYPNPNKGLLNFHMQTKESNIDIVVSDLNGQTLCTYSNFNAGNTFDKQIDLTGKLAAGNYVIRVITPSENFFRKITVLK